jgi:hypothetical protein
MSRTSRIALRRALASVCLVLAACEGQVGDGSDELDDGRHELTAGPIVATPIIKTTNTTGYRQLFLKDLLDTSLAGISGRFVVGKMSVSDSAFGCPSPQPMPGPKNVPIQVWKSYDLFKGKDVLTTTGERFCAYERLTYCNPDATGATACSKPIKGGKLAVPTPPAKTLRPTANELKALPGLCGPDDCNLGDAALLAQANWLEPVDASIHRMGDIDAARPKLAEAYRTRFKQQLGVSDNSPAVGTGALALPKTTLVYVLDDGTDANGDGQIDITDKDPHARAVGQVIKLAACSDVPGAACGVQIHFKDVFADQTKAAPASNTIELAQAVMEAVAAGAKVINMSLGAHPSHIFSNSYETSDPELRSYYAGYEALKFAINYAGCNNVLVVAAIGNRDGGSAEAASYSGAMYPGAWSNANERGWDCKTGNDAVRPLVIGVGAIGPTDILSPTTRPAGRAQFVAPGYMAPEDYKFAPSANAPTEPVPTPIYWEGSSFASAAFAGVAAAAWSYAPSLTAHETNDISGTSGTSLFRLLVNTGRQITGITPDVAFLEASTVWEPVQCRALGAALNATCIRRGGTDASCSASLTCPELPSPEHPARNWPMLSSSPETQGLIDAAGNAAQPQWNTITQTGCAEATSSNGQSLSSDTQTPQQSMCPFEQQLQGNGQRQRDAMCKQPGDGTPCRKCTISIKGGSGTIIVDDVDPDVAPESAALAVRLPSVAVPNALSLVPTTTSQLHTIYIEMDDVLAQFVPGEQLAIKLFDRPVGEELPDVSFEYVVKRGEITQAFSTPLPVIELPDVVPPSP